MATALVLLGFTLGGGSSPATAPAFPARDYRHLPRAPSGPVLIGSNYSHYRFRDCSWTDSGVLASLDRPGVALRVHRELMAMRRQGVQSLRTIVWYMTNPGPNRWGVVSSRGGRISGVDRSNLIAYLKEVRRFRFARLTISFGPQWSNDPIEDNYNPRKFAEDWRFIGDVRSLVRRYGPSDTRFDLLNEGAPSDYLPRARIRRMTRYDVRMYGLYVKHFGARDATISVIAPVSDYDQGNRLQNLIDAIRAAGLPEPRWFEVHAMLDYQRTLHALTDTQAVLEQNGLSAPIVAGEVPYDDPASARAIAEFNAHARNRVQEVLEWYHRPASECNASPPYRVDAYRGVLG